MSSFLKSSQRPLFLKIGARLALAYVPVVAGLLYFAGGSTWTDWNIFRKTSGAIIELIKLTPHAIDAVHELQKERDVSFGFLASKDEKMKELFQLQKEKTDFEPYTAIIGALIENIDQLSSLPSESGLARQARVLSAIVREEEQAIQERVVGTGLLSASQVSPDEFQFFATFSGMQSSTLDDVAREATPEQKVLWNEFETSAAAKKVALLRLAIAHQILDPAAKRIEPMSWFNAATECVDQLPAFG
jgi:hypothetical protein